MSGSAAGRPGETPRHTDEVWPVTVALRGAVPSGGESPAGARSRGRSRPEGVDEFRGEASAARTEVAVPGRHSPGGRPARPAHRPVGEACGGGFGNGQIHDGPPMARVLCSAQDRHVRVDEPGAGDDCRHDPQGEGRGDDKVGVPGVGSTLCAGAHGVSPPGVGGGVPARCTNPPCPRVAARPPPGAFPCHPFGVLAPHLGDHRHCVGRGRGEEIRRPNCVRRTRPTPHHSSVPSCCRCSSSSVTLTPGLSRPPAVAPHGCARLPECPG